MSDPVSNVEIEDVLTSIRRLVSDGEWGQSPAPRRDAVAEKPAEPEVPAKFVLTPALRIVEPSVQQDEHQEEPSEEHLHQDEDSSSGEQDDHYEEQPVHEEQDMPHDEVSANEEEGAHEVEHQSVEASDDHERPSLEDVIADLEAAVEHSHEWEDVADDYDDDGEELTFETNGFEASETFTSDVADQAFSAELDEDLAAYMDDENIIDEEALRKLVAEVIRQELQGALGERITRNVRKLVRREIYRILASEDFN